MAHVNQRIEKFDKEKTNLLHELEMLKIKENEESKKHIFDPEEFLIDWDMKDIEERKQIVKDIIKRVIITDDIIDIEWKH